MPNGIVTDYTYDKAGRLIAVVSKNPEGRVVSATEYTLDPTGNRTAMKLTLDGKVQFVKYEFDDAYRLTKESRFEGIDFTGDGNAIPAPVYDETFTYDALGNRLGSTRIDKAGLLAQDDEAANAIVKTESTYNDANQITGRVLTFKDGHTETERYTYDANGNTAGIKTTGENDKLLKTVNMTYDWLNRQTEWKQTMPARDGEDGSTVYEKQVYRGNAWKRIATITHDGETTSTVKYLYDGDNVVADFDEKNTLVAQYVTPMLDQNVSMKRGDKIYYYTQDGLGSVRSVTDSSGTIANTNDYTAFGEQVTKNTVNAVKNRYAYTGRERSSLAFANALATFTSVPMYYRWRMYDSFLGCFKTRDIIQYHGNFQGNIYTYVSSRPIYWADEFGLRDPTVDELDAINRIRDLMYQVDMAIISWGSDPELNAMREKLKASYEAIELKIANEPEIDKGTVACCCGLALVDGPVPAGDACAVVLIAGTGVYCWLASNDHAPELDAVAILVESGLAATLALFSSTQADQVRKINSYLEKPFREHIDKMNENDFDPNKWNTWIRHAQKAINNAKKVLERMRSTKTKETMKNAIEQAEQELSKYSSQLP